MRTQTAMPRLAALVCIMALGSAVAQPRIPPTYHAAPNEVAQLPKYCYNQYLDGALGGYQFSIPHESCGYAMNHFCPGLVWMLKAQKMSLPKAERVGSIQHAIMDIDYTIREMKPGCFISKDVFYAKERAQQLSKLVK